MGKKCKNCQVLTNFPKLSTCTLKEQKSAFRTQSTGAQGTLDLQVLCAQPQNSQMASANSLPVQTSLTRVNRPPWAQRLLHTASVWCSLQTRRQRHRTLDFGDVFNPALPPPQQQGHLCWLLLYFCKQGWWSAWLSTGRPQFLPYFL
jgi:hypothetical protein